MARKLFCEYNRVFYFLSLRKEWLLRFHSDARARLVFASRQKSFEKNYFVAGHKSLLMRELLGVDKQLQYNKITNLRLAAPYVNSVAIHPGQTFSFWRLIGRCTKTKGYLPGLTISGGKLGQDIGGGICQLANLIHWLVLHSPLSVTELHHHTDALFPDTQRRVPFGTGTSVFFNNVDYRFCNNTSQSFYLNIWLDDTHLLGEVWSDKAVNFRYKIVEENHHFAQTEDGFYRNSSIYRVVTNRTTAEQHKELLLHNHSKVYYDSGLIPPEQIRRVHHADTTL